jgi:hypothetical protein
MNTSILTVVLAGALLAGQNGNPTWQNSYTTAQKMGAEQQKPVLVVIGSGANGWTKVIRDAAPAPEVTQMMAQKFVCVYINTATPEGKQLAQSFEITGSGLVISDRSGMFQAFWHQGDVTNQNMARYLESFASPRAMVNSTATATTIRDSSYPAQGAAATKTEKIDPPAKPAAVRTPAWQSDYSKALAMATAQQKPVCMVFCSSPNGTAKMLGENPSAECMQLLCDKYVCVCVDMTTPAGKKLAQECSITGETGMVISDRACMTQVFWHQGPLAHDTMVRCLTRYCDPQVTVRTTETANTVRTSFYPTSAEADGGPSINGSSYCPSCNNARRR